jgi:hypothetical protein
MDEKIQATVKVLSDRLRETNATPYTLDVADPSAIKLLSKNARYMSHEMFENLVSNIKRDGALSSMPLCYREPDGTLLVLSGNHRVQAAAQAGLKQILVMVIDKELTREEQVAVQLSHNAIDGKDDPPMLKQLWDEIKPDRPEVLCWPRQRDHQGAGEDSVCLHLRGAAGIQGNKAAVSSGADRGAQGHADRDGPGVLCGRALPLIPGPL